MQRSARTAQTIRPSLSGSSTMQPATGQAAWQIEHANAPKQRSGSITAIVFGAFLRGPDIIFVHMYCDYSGDDRLEARGWRPGARGPSALQRGFSVWPEGGSPNSGIV